MTDDASMDMGEPDGPSREPHIVEKIAAINVAFESEVATWQRNGLHPGNLMINTSFLNSQVGSLMAYLSKIIPEFDDREWELKWKEDLVAYLIQQRLFLVAERTKQDITAGIVDGNGNPIQVPKM